MTRTRALRSLLTAVVGASLLSAGCDRPSVMTDGDVARRTVDDRHRPRFHFTPPARWMNDPNGLVFYDGEYHLFYQHYPDDTVWGPMHWGHAVSTDLVHWQDLPIALYPDEHGYVFSGSAVVDWDNTSGLGEGGTPPLVAIFTHHDPQRRKAGTNDHETQGIAYSNDRGRTWTKFGGNPVLPNRDKRGDFRDPNVFWHEAGGRWILVLSAHDHVELWGSPNLMSWEHLSSFGAEWGGHDGVWECPDLFPLRVEGTDETKWVLIVNLNPGGPNGGSGTQYFVGGFDGESFTLDAGFAETLRGEPAVWLDWGRDNYAGVTWSDIPAADGRRVFIGWMSNWDYAQDVPTDRWRSAMTVPRTLRLVDTAAGYRLFAEPVAELATLREDGSSVSQIRFDGQVDLGEQTGISPSPSEIRLVFDLESSDAAEIGIVLANGRSEEYRLVFRVDEATFVSDRRGAGDHAFAESFADRVHRAPRLSDSGELRLHLLLDVASIEMFADDGGTVLTDIFFPSTPFDRIQLYAEGGEAVLLDGEMYRLKSIWRRSSPPTGARRW